MGGSFFMLKENISYFEGLPIQFSLLSIGEYPVHRHDALELLYILSGEIDVKSTFYHLTLKKRGCLSHQQRRFTLFKRKRREKHHSHATYRFGPIYCISPLFG